METRHAAQVLTQILQYESAYQRWLDASLVRAQGTNVELLLSYRAEFAGARDQIEASLRHWPSTQVPLSCGLPTRLTGRALQMDYHGEAAAGNALHAQARVLDHQVLVEIRTNDDRVLVAHATLYRRSRKPAMPQPRMVVTQPIYPN